MGKRLAVTPDDEEILRVARIPGVALATVPIFRRVELVGEGAEH
jgi:hypothetical protein